MVLRPIEDWHRVLLVASSDLGVFMPMDRVTKAVEKDGVLTLAGGALRARIDPAPVRDIYIFEDSTTGPGTSKSIQAFGAAGEPLLKVVIFHKPSFRAALAWTAPLADPNQSRTWQPARRMRTDDRRADAALAEPGSATAAFGAFLDRARSSGRHLVMKARSPGLELDWQGQLTKVKQDGAMIHLHEATLRAHLNLAKTCAITGSDTMAKLHVAGQAEPALEIAEGEV